MVNRVALYDVMKWVKEIKEKGFTVFTFDDLKEHNLDHQSFIFKAKTAGLVRAIGKVLIERDGVDSNLTQWLIIPEKLNRKSGFSPDNTRKDNGRIRVP
jgi:hypothetical protein